MKIQQKIVVIPLAVMLLVSTFTIFTIEQYLQSHLMERNIKELRLLATASLESVRTVEALESVLDGHPDTRMPQTETHAGGHSEDHIIMAFQRLAENFAHAGDFRVTYFDAAGKVLGDSDSTLDQLKYVENHADRPEVKAALKVGMGMSERYSDMLETNMMFVAVRANEANYTDEHSYVVHPIIARVARSQDSVSEALHELREALVFTGVISLVVVLFLGILGARVLNKAVNTEHQLLERRVQDRTTEIQMLQTLGGLLNACSTLEEAGEVMNSVIPKLLPEFRGSISIIKSSRNRLDRITEWGGEWPGADRFSPGECWALRKGHQHLAVEHGIETYCRHWLEIPEKQQTLCIPLLAQGETIGILHFVLPPETEADRFQGMWSAVSEQIGLTLANIQLRDSLREQAIRDPLTGLFNRRYMLEALDQAHSRAERTGTDIAVMMIDLDHFKLFNDNFGHDAGDHVLKAVSQALKDSLRQEDIACRYGGEEFCVVCPSTSEVQARQIAERICKSIRKLELSMNQLSLGTVTTSIGIAVYPQHGAAMDDVIRVADEALYAAKQNGRDRAEVAVLPDAGVSEQPAEPATKV
ncbi:sensor domain-containing diguanylate cyclase [Aliamphritea spongicola]|uniref:sensor domain-containing diguanylate cyclase n=1 Tax=Aliamphritea spongicola TaxID=707589 RepID=UPI00196B7804|nr:diguanylate cyclase [Aliamphritea spongicola]MBN3563429.1 diguanylate cyclase [Aliamphritea spongicola]